MAKKVTSLAKLISKLRMILSLAEDPYSVSALLTWPKFSTTSYKVVAGIKKRSIVPKTVLDVGAHVGQFAVASAKLFPDARVYSFEPVPDSVERLRKNTSGLRNVVVYSLALGNHQGEAPLRINSDRQQSSVLPLAQARRDAFPSARETQVVRVNVSTLDQVCSGIELRPPVLLKLDVQGYEAQVLYGGAETLGRVDYVLLEASFEPTYEGEVPFMDLVRIMEQHGFRFERPLSCLAVPGRGEILEMDALFVRAI